MRAQLNLYPTISSILVAGGGQYIAREAPGDPKPLLKRQRMWKPNVRPSSPKLCVLAGDATSGKIKRGSSTLLENHVDDGGGTSWMGTRS